MDTLLRIDFTTHYAIPACTITDLKQEVNHPRFEVADIAKKLVISTVVNSGAAVFNNPNGHLIAVVDYDRFLSACPPAFQMGKKRCDMIAYNTSAPNIFILGELKDRKYHPIFNASNIQDVKDQLLHTIWCIKAVPSIQGFINTFAEKRACYFNKKPGAPVGLSAVTAFNRVNTIAKNGFLMPDATLNAEGYDYWEYFPGNGVNI